MSASRGPLFEIAQQQFEQVAGMLAIPPDEPARVLYFKRVLTVAIPVHLDDGRMEVLVFQVTASSTI